MECLVEDLQVEQELGTQAQGGVVINLFIFDLSRRSIKKYLEVEQRSPKKDQKYLQKEQETHLEIFLKQRRQSGKNESERVQQTIGVPKRQHYEKHKDDERQDYNTYTLFEFCHNQGNNKVQIETQVYCAHEAEEERNKQIQRSKGDDDQGMT